MQVAVTHSLGESSDRLHELLTAPHDAGCTVVPLLYCTLMSQLLYTLSHSACLYRHPFLIVFMSQKSKLHMHHNNPQQMPRHQTLQASSQARHRLHKLGSKRHRYRTCTAGAEAM